MKKLGVPGVSIAVIKDFKIHWAKGYGLADVESARAVDTHTLFQAASISKPITAMAFLKATQQGRVSLDADVNTMLKSWQVPKSDLTKDSPVTPRHFFSHTSGFGRRLRLSRLRSRQTPPHARANSKRGKTLQCRRRALRAPALRRVQILRRRNRDHAARNDRNARKTIRANHARTACSIRSR